MAMPREPEGRNTAAVRKRNKEAVRRIMKAFNTGDTKLVDDAIHPNLLDHTPAFRTNPGREGVKQQIEMYRKVFPDAKFKEELIIAEGNMVFLRWEMTGTFRGKLFGRQGNGKKITHHGHEILLFDSKGMNTEHIDTFNVTAFLDKLGVMDSEMLGRLQDAGILSTTSDKSAFLNPEALVTTGKRQ
jgi:predicted ester cyclase